ncbi:MAG: hypothetical protein A2428_14050 [Bdellovibrionales bacterium RIFOXYC1_FULL_54_43]|nr:MAG: hypothetical protein A2428_14050 [Bdellovibrionales bacterium RIFOXYC1_FULL_54_43]
MKVLRSYPVTSLGALAAVPMAMMDRKLAKLPSGAGHFGFSEHLGEPPTGWKLKEHLKIEKKRFRLKLGIGGAALGGLVADMAMPDRVEASTLEEHYAQHPEDLLSLDRDYACKFATGSKQVMAGVETSIGKLQSLETMISATNKKKSFTGSGDLMKSSHSPVSAPAAGFAQ